MKLHSEAKRDVWMRSALSLELRYNRGSGGDSKVLQLQRSRVLEQGLS
jgi:hypothetical protein